MHSYLTIYGFIECSETIQSLKDFTKHFEHFYSMKQENHCERWMLPNCLVSVKGRTCNPNTTCTPRHDKENHLLWKRLGEITQVKCMVRVTSIHVPSLISITFVLSKIWPRHTSLMKTKWLRGDKTVNIHGRRFLCTALPLTAIYI